MKKDNDNLTIVPPEGYDTILYGNIIKFRKVEPKVQIKTWNDLVNNNEKIPKKSCFISSFSCINNTREVKSGNIQFCIADKNLFIDRKHAEASLAMSQISQLIPYYGGTITEDEWKNTSIPKYCIDRDSNLDLVITKCLRYEFLAFHSENQANEFLKNNRELCKNLKMM